MVVEEHVALGPVSVSRIVEPSSRERLFLLTFKEIPKASSASTPSRTDAGAFTVTISRI